MANVEGFTFSNTDTVTGDRSNTNIRDAVIDLANNVSGELDGANIADGTIPVAAMAAGAGFATGMVMGYAADAELAGWVRCNGRTIGNAASSATERANADTETLYLHLWNQFADAQLAVSSGRGTAQGDFDAGKTIDLPDARGRGLAFLDDMGNTDANRITSAETGVDGALIGDSGGVEAHTLLKAELPTDVVTGTNGAITMSGATEAGTSTFTVDHAAGGSVVNLTIGTPSSPALDSEATSGNAEQTINVTTPALAVGTLAASTPSFTGDAMGSGDTHTNLAPTLIIGSAIIKL